MTKAEREQMMLEKLKEMQNFEQEICPEGVEFIAGVDEVGRGPLAGPVVTACVILPKDFDVPGIDDSKKLSEKRRNELATIIKERALAWGLGKASEQVIDEINILNATKGAMKVAIEQAVKRLSEKYESVEEEKICVLIDAVKLDGLAYTQKPIIKGDAKSVSIAAASILAKVTRDAMMVKMADVYPGYAFEKNKGYGTAEHYKGLREHGVTPIHRKSFLKNFLGEGTATGGK